MSEGVITLSGPIQHKRGTSAALEVSDYIPAAGELVIATDTGEMKCGDGEHCWNELGYVMRGVIESLVTRVVDLEEQIAADAEVEAMLDAVFAGETAPQDDDPNNNN